MTSAERFLTTVQQREADRVPFILPVMLHGARLMGLSLEAYFDDAEAVAESQVRLQQRYGHDAIVSLYFAAMEHEAWGGSVRFFEDGPPNAGAPLVRSVEQIPSLRAPEIGECPRLQKMLQSIRLMRRALGESVPIIGAIVAPNSVPVMQLGFEAYLHVLLERRDLYDALMAINEPFAVAWANAQVEAGASVVVYFDPISSPTVMPRGLFQQTGLPLAKRVFSQVRAPMGVGLASGRALPIIPDLIEAGAAAVGVSCDDDLAACKRAAAGRITVMGNLNGIAMRRWTHHEVEAEVRRAIDAAAAGGGFVLSEHHGEVPLQVSDDTLLAIAEAAQRWGRYPLRTADA